MTMLAEAETRIGCGRCGMTLVVKRPIQGERLRCSECKRRFWTTSHPGHGHGQTCQVGILPEDLDEWSVA